MRNMVCFAVMAAVFYFWPDGSDLLGSLQSFLLLGLGLVVVIPIAVYFAILRSLPEEVPMSQLAEFDVPRALHGHVADFEALGFEALAPLRIHLPGNEAVMVPLVNREERMFATVFKIESEPPKIAYDVVSVLDAPEAGLTTGMDHGAGVMPVEPSCLRQIQQDATPAELVDLHRTALRALHRARLPALDVDPAALPALLEQSFVLNRRAFLRARVSNTFVALWRTLRKTNPHMVPLMQQPASKEQVQAIRKTQAKAAKRVRYVEPARV